MLFKVRYLLENEQNNLFKIICDFRNNSANIIFSDWSLKLYQQFISLTNNHQL